MEKKSRRPHQKIIEKCKATKLKNKKTVIGVLTNLDIGPFLEIKEMKMKRKLVFLPNILTL
jgi:hypothetical protein